MKKKDQSYFTILKPVNLDLPLLLDSANEFEVAKNQKIQKDTYTVNNSIVGEKKFDVVKGAVKIKAKTFKKHLPKLYYILHIIQNQIINNSEYSHNSYVNLDSQILKGILGSEYRKYLNVLLYLNVIESNESYYYGTDIDNYSKSYRYTEDYRKANKEVYKVDDPKGQIMKNASNVWARKTQNLVKHQDHIQKLHSEFTSLLNNFDSDNAYKYINHCRGLEIPVKDKVISKGKFYFVEKNRTFNDEIQKDYKQKVAAISNNESYFKSDAVNRIHNNFTELPRILVPFIKDHSGYSMIELDASASLICILYRNLVKYKEKYKKEGVIKDMGSYDYELSLLNHTLSYTPDQPNKKDIYNLILSKIDQPEWTRDDVKERMFSTFLFQVKEKDSTIKTAFSSLFPLITKVIVHIRKGGHDVFSRDLMKLESKVFQSIWKRIPVEVDGCSWIPKHDAILVDKSSSEEVKAIMIEELSIFTGLKAWVKDKDHQQTYDEIIQNLESMKGYSSMKKVEYQSKVSSNVTEDMRLEKRIERLEKAVNTEIDENDLFDTIYKQSSIEQLEQINVNKNNTNDMNINQNQKEEVELSDYDSDQDTVEDISNTFERKYDPVKGYYYEGYSPNLAKIENPDTPLDSIELNGSERWYLYEIMLDYYNGISSFTWDFTRNRMIDRDSFFGLMSDPDHHTKIRFNKNIMENVRDIILRAKQKELAVA
ncbi:hypothetical protein WJR50_18920 [Catalinimonas sp. 4WD22]|uniref:hypothetical protein n=1 Tax=Catalinimonas locisalis TaxID=3133978 RepID=UPI0031012950